MEIDYDDQGRVRRIEFSDAEGMSLVGLTTSMSVSVRQPRVGDSVCTTRRGTHTPSTSPGTPTSRTGTSAAMAGSPVASRTWPAPRRALRVSRVPRADRPAAGEGETRRDAGVRRRASVTGHAAAGRPRSSRTRRR